MVEQTQMRLNIIQARGGDYLNTLTWDTMLILEMKQHKPQVKKKNSNLRLTELCENQESNLRLRNDNKKNNFSHSKCEMSTFESHCWILSRIKWIGILSFEKGSISISFALSAFKCLVFILETFHLNFLKFSCIYSQAEIWYFNLEFSQLLCYCIFGIFWLK